MLTCIDNSGAALVECVMVLKRKKPAGIGTLRSRRRRRRPLLDRHLLIQPTVPGDKIVVVIQKQRSLGQDLSATAQAAVKVRRGDVCHAVVVRTKKKYNRPDGSYVRFDDNACVLVSKAGDPLGTRLSGGSLVFFFSLLPLFGVPHRGGLIWDRCGRRGIEAEEVVQDTVSCADECIGSVWMSISLSVHVYLRLRAGFNLYYYSFLLPANLSMRRSHHFYKNPTANPN